MWPLVTGPALIGLLLTALSVAAGPTARAQEDPRTVARGKLLEGSDLLKKGEFREALIRFQEAYGLFPSPKIFYNFGLSYMGLSRTVEAIESFEKFLAEAPDGDQKANADRFRNTLLQQIANLVIEANVEGAEITVDGRARGVTPAPGPIRLDPGPHLLLVEKAGFPPYTRKMSVEPGQKMIVEVRLTKEAAPAAPAPIIMMAPTPAAEPAKPVLTHSWKWKAGIGLGVAAVAVLGFGVVERLSANGSYGDFNTQQTSQGPGKCDADDRVRDHGGEGCDDLLSKGDSAASKATFGFIAGGVLAAASAALMAVTWNEPLTEKRAAAQPSRPRRLSALRCSPIVAQPGIACALAF